MQTVPEGWKLVPIEPTETMMNAGLYQSSHDAQWEDVFSSYKDMLAAAPEPPALDLKSGDARLRDWAAMTTDEQKALRMVEGGLALLRNAIIKGDPHRELEFRARDLLADVEGIIGGKAHIIAQFGHLAKT